jgi:transcriptional regulator with XRE-family HTH domain
MSIQKLRLKRGWSQQQLADASGLSVRTIQRLENGLPASTESLNSLAAVFEIDFSTLSQEQEMIDANSPESNLTLKQEKAAFRQVRRLRGFYMHLFQLIPAALILAAVNFWVSPHRLWAPWVMLLMVLGLLVHGTWVFGSSALFGPQWELKQIEKRLGRPL